MSAPLPPAATCRLPASCFRLPALCVETSRPRRRSASAATFPSIVATASFLVLAELAPGADLERDFHRNRKWIFGLLFAAVAVSLIEDYARSRAARLDANSAFRAGFLALTAAGWVIESTRAQLVVALAFLATLVTYIAVVFERL